MAKKNRDDAFLEWWAEDGRFYDPDSSDVDWYDKRHGLAEYAWDAAARRCAEIASAKVEEMSDLCNMVGVAVADDIMLSIRREFGLEKEPYVDPVPCGCVDTKPGWEEEKTDDGN